MEQVTVIGTLEHIVYRSEKTGYTVAVLASSEEEYTVVGVMPDLDTNDYVEIQGEEIEHPMYGTQIRVTRYQRKLPQDVLSMKRYLGSGVIKGIGERLAERIVTAFGADTFRVIEEEPERLAEIKGISEAKAQDIAKQVAGRQSLRNALMFLQGYGLSTGMSMKVYTEFSEDIYQVVRTNPYQLAERVPGIGFKTADEIAAKVGIVADSDFRIQAGMEYVLNQAGGNGHTYLPKEQLFFDAAELLQVSEEQLEKNLMDMVMDRRLMVKEREEIQVYLAKYYYTELAVARKLQELSSEEERGVEVWEKRLRAIEEKENLTLDEQQHQAVMTAIRYGLTVVTGGPGTGKTTTINTMIHFFESQNMEIALAAPTGRAAKRMTETTGYEALTIHRLLEVTGIPEEGGAKFARDELAPLEYDVIIIDEMSMVDIFLMHALLKAIVPGTRLILVGDVDQLPSVGPGCVLRDIILSDCFQVVKLTKIFRQAAQSDIIINAHKINQGEWVEPKMGSKDFLFVQRQIAAQIIGATITLVQSKLPKYVGADMREIQVLTPMRKGVLGVENLNHELQGALNPPAEGKREKEHGGVIFREGDKVMQIKNNYQKEWEVVNRHNIPIQTGLGVFNGDLGVIRSINLFTEQVEIEFDGGRRASYGYAQLEELELAYAVTIHKAQGSEYPAIVLPLLTGPRMLMNRNLLYTAVTRAKQCVTVVGSVETFQQMIENKQEMKRYSGLRERIREVHGKTMM